MSVLIKGMEMPTSCFYCPFREKVNPDDYVCLAINKEFEETFSLIAGKRHKDCPLVPVPDHGRLIDADDFLNGLLFPSKQFEQGMRELIGDAPTVIPAEETNERK